MQLNQDDFVDLKHLLPPSFAGLVEVIGLAMAFELVENSAEQRSQLAKIKPIKAKCYIIFWRKSSAKTMPIKLKLH